MLGLYLENPKETAMGHYYSEMHVTTPHEEYLEKAKRAREILGFFDFEINFKRWFVCHHCSCMILSVTGHIPHCNALDSDTKNTFADQVEAAKYQIVASLAHQAVESESGPRLERLKLLAECADVGLDAFVFDIALKQLETDREICRYIDPSMILEIRQYRDEVYELAMPKDSA